MLQLKGLIVVHRCEKLKLFNTQNYGHRGLCLGDLFTGMQGQEELRILANFNIP